MVKGFKIEIGEPYGLSLVVVSIEAVVDDVQIALAQKFFLALDVVLRLAPCLALPGFPFGTADSTFPRFDRTVDSGESVDAAVGDGRIFDMAQQVCDFGDNDAFLRQRGRSGEFLLGEPQYKRLFRNGGVNLRRENVFVGIVLV